MDTPAYYTEPDQYFLKEDRYTGSHPNFYNPTEFPWVRDLESKYEVIVAEFDQYLKELKELPVNLNPPYLSSPDAWRHFYFMNFRWYDHVNCLKNPKTFAIIQSIPNVSLAGITMLEPHGRVLPHIGETNAVIRCHMGLHVPGHGLDCGIRVNGEDKAHENGKVLMFSDAHLHETWNRTDQRRVILAFDIVPPQFAHKSNWVCANSLAALTIKYVDEKVRIIKPLPDPILQAMLKSLAVVWYIYLPIQKRFRWIAALKLKLTGRT